MIKIRKIASIGAGLVLALMVGCQSTPLKSPVLDAGTGLQTDWIEKYKKARAIQIKQNDEACKIFTELANEKRFPAHQVAELRMYESCQNTATSLDRKKYPLWLRDLALEVGLKLAIYIQDKPAELELATEKSKQRLPQREKVKWIETAMARAEELGNTKAIADLKRRLYRVAPRLNPQPQAKDLLDVANDWRMARQFDKAHSYYEQVISSRLHRLDDKIAALRGVRLAYKNARQIDLHIKACERLVNYMRQATKLNPKVQSVWNAAYEAEVYWARALWTHGQGPQAREIFLGLEKRMKGKVSLAELHWLLGRMAEEENNHDAVSQHMQNAMNERIRNPELRDKILWYSAWNEIKRKNFTLAAALLTQLDLETQTDFTRMRTLFWLGKIYADLKRTEDATHVFNRLITLDPLGYYGLLAHRQLGLSISFKSISAEQNKIVSTEKLPLDEVLADWLGMIEEKEALTALLNQATIAYRKQKNQTNEGWVTLFKHYAKGGLYMKLYESLGSLTPERRRSVLESHPELLFPQPWREEVASAALEHGVEEELIYAIMRQESAFDTQARSVADAFGLMQILPEIAQEISKRTKVPYTQMEDLYDPRTNVQIGAAHIRDLMKRHKNQFILAVAAYNANENAIRKWVRMRFNGDPLQFIEEIPYEETRGYVRLVMRNLIFYSLLKSKSASIEFPAWVLNLDAS